MDVARLAIASAGGDSLPADRGREGDKRGANTAECRGNIVAREAVRLTACRTSACPFGLIGLQRQVSFALRFCLSCSLNDCDMWAGQAVFEDGERIGSTSADKLRLLDDDPESSSDFLARQRRGQRAETVKGVFNTEVTSRRAWFSG
ncbi:hypothetical protein C0Q70_00547 [Pomacea canaliculata]|uniref:Uncharacterized protein n=1 Tax=Pomacea canaliculata TaxID=400727 RepID=A0A2T7PWZ8_POMCA|nr:hypothetical protein C0Q70_00547 [Pomacea canaliculata]